MQKIRAFLLWLGGAIWWFAEELFKAFGFDRVIQIMKPWDQGILHYGPPIIFFCIGIWILLKKQNEKKKSTSISQDKKNPEISIIIGHSGHYMESNSYNTVNVTKTVLIGVKNTGSTKLTNCKVMFEVRNSETNAPEQWLRKEAFRLDVGDEEFISMASFNEPVSTNDVGAGIDIGLSAPPSGACWDPPNPRLPKDGGIVTIIASSAESKSCSVICKLWVVDNKLHWDRA